MIGMLQNSDQDSRNKYWEKICPPLYRETTTEKLPPKALKCLKELSDWNPSAGRGLIFVGAARQGKSRLAWLLLEKHVLQTGISVKYFDGLGWPLAVARAFGSPSDTERWLDSVCNVQVLFLDDAFKQKLTDAQEAAYLGVLERRAAYKLPLIMTFNSTAKQLRQRMTAAGAADRIEPIIKRLEEFNSVFTL